MAPIKATGSDKDPAYSYLRDLHAEAEDTEASRLLYVAATRAERRLHLLACVKCDEHSDPKPPSAHTLLARAWPVAEEFFSEAPAEPAREVRQPEPIYSINRLAPDFRMPRLPDPVRWTPPLEGRDEEEIEFSWAGETARHAGSVVHRWLLRIAEEGLSGWDSKRVDSLRSRFARELEHRGVPSANLNKSTDIVAVSLKNTLTDKCGCWILSPHPNARSEYRIRVRAPGAMQTLVMDRMFRDDHGLQWIVDYKTSVHEGTGAEAFLDRERGRYAPQLQAYVGAVKDARAGLYFPFLKGWREIT